MVAGLRAMAKAVETPPEPKVRAPVLDPADELKLLRHRRRKGRQQIGCTLGRRATSRLYRLPPISEFFY
jgi:hypothetical protein